MNNPQGGIVEINTDNRNEQNLSFHNKLSGVKIKIKLHIEVKFYDIIKIIGQICNIVPTKNKNNIIVK